MIPVLLMIAGAGLFLYGTFMLIKGLTAPMRQLMDSADGKQPAAATEKEKRARQSDRKRLMTLSGALAATGLIVFMLGWYIGFAVRDNGFWLYKLIYPHEEAVPASVTEDGKYIAEDGSAYYYRILVTGNGYKFCEKSCADAEALREELSKVGRENTVLLRDDFAVAARYREAVKLLEDMGIRYETEEAE